ncbi:MAG: hypothetical protein HGB08_04670 [Candidatus Moranbacteria bacterium]|nr:hypothetical protein [Candidatus Moranbacteria bacterium]
MKIAGNKNRKGYLILEAILAVFIVGTTFTVFMTVLSKTYSSEYRNRDYAIASGLAQEGIELVRNIRDNNWKEGDVAFDSSSSGTFMFAYSYVNGCYWVDYKDVDIRGNHPCSNMGQGLSNLNIDTNGFYTTGSGTVTKFKREVKIKTDGDKRNIDSTVYWIPSGSSSYTSLTVSDILYPWADKQ